MARILVAEDDRDIAWLIDTVLTGLGHEVRTVADGVSAHAQLTQEHWDLAVLDVGLPGKSGLDVVRELRADDDTGEIPRVMMLTAHAFAEAEKQGRQAGADDYVVKPFALRDLRARVTGLLAG